MQDYQTPYAISNLGSVIEIFIAVFSNVIVIFLYLFASLKGSNRFLVILAFLVLVFATWWIIRRGLSSRMVMSAYLGNPPPFSLTVWLLCLLLITFNMFAYGASLYVTIMSMNVTAEALTFWGNWLQLTYTFSIAWLIGFLVFVFPSGLGLREVTLAGLLVINFSLSFESASAVSVLFRLWVTVAELLWIMVMSWHWIGKKFTRTLS